MKAASFTYHYAKPTDVEHIVTLFKLCLGTAGGAPTVAFWNWKHNENPAGVSPVILAWDEDQLIGIRAFMCFRFIKNNQTYVGYRPVDTATHPDYQGKGIFKNLTLTLLEDLKKKEETAFIFNTPNSQSKPGYLKMGWVAWGKPLLQLLPAFSIFGTRFKQDQERLLQYDFSILVPSQSDRLAVHKDAAYFVWRYQKISLPQYGMKILHVNDTKYTIIYRKKKIRFLNEFRICDVLKNNSICTEIPTALLFKLFFSFGFGVLSFINRKTFWLTLQLNNKAPIITYRNINEEDEVPLFNDVDFSIGELELF